MAKAKKSLPQIGGLDYKRFREVKTLIEKYNKLESLYEQLDEIIGWDSQSDLVKNTNITDRGACLLIDLRVELELSTEEIYYQVLKLSNPRNLTK